MNWFYPLFFMCGNGGCNGCRHDECCCQTQVCPSDGCDPGLVRVSKIADYPEVRCGDRTEVRLDVTNSANVPLHVTVRDELFAGACPIPGSTAVDGVAEPNADPLCGVDLGVLQPGQTVTVHYSMTVSRSGCSRARVWYVPEGALWTPTAADCGCSNRACWNVL